MCVTMDLDSLPQSIPNTSQAAPYLHLGCPLLYSEITMLGSSSPPASMMSSVVGAELSSQPAVLRCYPPFVSAASPAVREHSSYAYTLV